MLQNLSAANGTFSGTITGNGASVTALNASNLSSGTVAFARLPTSHGRVTSDWSNTSATFTDVTGLSWAIGASENWTADAVLYVIGGSGGTGIKFKVTGPSSPTSVLITIFGTGLSGSTSFAAEIQTVFSTSGTVAFASGSNLSGMVRIHIVVINGSNSGTVQIQANNSGASGTAYIKTNSDILATRTN